MDPLPAKRRRKNINYGQQPKRGAIIKVPLFINEGEKIQVDTRTGEYLGRVKE